MRALLFPGQGSQAVGMGKGWFDEFDWAREMFATADRVLGEPLSQICFQGPEDRLRQTVHTQPALFTVEAVIFEALRRRGLSFDAVAGHSLGEYTALFAAGVASFADLVKLVRLRAQAMGEACPTGTGTMAAILMLDRAVVDEVCQAASSLGVCVAANFNCPGQIVISGATAAVEEAGRLAKERKARRVMPLNVSGPFHSPMMAPAAQRLAAALDTVTFQDAAVPVYTNVDAEPTRSAADLKRKLVQQITGAVRWEDTLRRLGTDGATHLIEVGPGAVLAGMARKTLTGIAVANAETPADVATLPLDAAAAAAATGAMEAGS